MKPAFIIAGVQKAATTALHHYLRQHEQIFLPEKKELHFFDNEKFDWSSPPVGNYHRNFANAPSGSICGEATPIYVYWRPSLARIQAYDPCIKLIVSLREPVARAYSAWRMIRAWGKEPLSFSMAIREGRQRVVDGDEVKGQHRLFSYVERGFYAEQIARIRTVFPDEQILYLNSGDLDRKKEQTLELVCSFLGVEDFSKYPQGRSVFSHKQEIEETIDHADVDYLNTLYEPDKNYVRENLGFSFGEYEE